MNILPQLTALSVGILFVGCQMTPAMLAQKELAPVPPSLADRLPGDTIAFISLPDIVAMRANMKHSALMKIYHDSEMQSFLAGGLTMLEEAWVEVRAAAAEQGIPDSLTHFDALRSFEAGFAVRVQPGVSSPFDAPPQIYALARVGVAPGLGPQIFDVVLGMLPGQFEPSTDAAGRKVATLMEGTEEDQPMTVTFTGTDDAIEFEFVWGAVGAGHLADSETYRRAWHRNSAPGSAVFGYLHFNEVLRSLFDGLADAEPSIAGVLEELHGRVLDPMESVSFSSGWDEDGSFTHAALDMSAAAAGDELWATEPFDRSLAEQVPADATAFSLTSTNSGPWLDLILRTMDSAGTVQPNGAPATLSQLLEGQAPELHAWLYGLHRPELNRALASFGTRSFGYSVPTSALSASSYTFVELTDPAGMSAVLEQLMPRLREVLKGTESPFQLDMRRMKRKVEQADGTVAEVPGPAYYWLKFDYPPELQQLMGFLGQTFQPCFAVAPEGWLVLSMNLDSVREVLDQGMPRPEASILENEDAARFLAALPKAAYSASWSDPRPAVGAAIGMIGGMLPMLAGMIPGEIDLPVDLASFPTPAAFVRNLRTSESHAFTWLGDFRSTNVGSIGFADLFTLTGALAALAPPFLEVAKSMQELPSSDAPPPSEVEF
jgi:hypothetical protein